MDIINANKREKEAFKLYNQELTRLQDEAIDEVFKILKRGDYSTLALIACGAKEIMEEIIKYKKNNGYTISKC